MILAPSKSQTSKTNLCIDRTMLQARKLLQMLLNNVEGRQ